MANPIIGQKAPTPLPELLEKFPELPRSIIVKNDVLNWGIRYTPILNWIGKWTVSLGSHVYTTIPEEVKDGQVSRSVDDVDLFDVPQSMVLRDGTHIQLLIKKDAPYEVRYEGDGTYMLYWNGLAVEEVLFFPRPDYLSKKLKDGTPIPLVVLPASEGSC